MTTPRDGSAVAALSAVLTRVYGAILVLASFAGAYNYVKVLGNRLSSGSGAFPAAGPYAGIR